MSSTTHTNLASLNTLWRELGLSGDPAPWHARLLTAYNGPSRHYHNLQHIDECLREVDTVKAFVHQPAQLRVALWFHDAVYDSRSTRNEEDSADLAASCLGAAGASAETIQGVRELVMCTKSHQVGSHPDGALITDIDLAILGQPPERFDAYEQGVRAEYDWVPLATFCSKRAEILTGFLARPSMYVTGFFRERYEVPARRNLARSVTALQAKIS